MQKRRNKFFRRSSLLRVHNWVPDDNNPNGGGGGGTTGGNTNTQNNIPPTDLPTGNTVNLPQEEYEKIMALVEAVNSGAYVQKSTYEDKVKEASDAKITAEKTAQELGTKMADIAQKAGNLGISLKDGNKNYVDLMKDYGEQMKERFGFVNYQLSDRSDELERDIKNLEAQVQESNIFKTTVGSKNTSAMVNNTKIARVAKGELV